MFMNYSSDTEYWSITANDPLSFQKIVNSNNISKLAEIYKSYHNLFLNSLETWSDNKIKNIKDKLQRFKELITIDEINRSIDPR